MPSFPKEADAAMRNAFIPKLVDNVSHNTFFFEQMWAKRVVQVGGSGWDQPIEYALNPNVATYDKYGVFPREPYEGATKSTVTWADYVVTMPFSGKENRENAGPQGISKMIDLAAMKVKSGEKAFKDRLCYDLYCDGAAYQFNGKTVRPMGGLKKIIAADRTYGGIDSSESGAEFWDGYVKAATSGVVWQDLYTSTDPDYLPTTVDEVFEHTNIGSDKVTLILCDEVTWGAWHRIAQSKESIVKSGKTVGRGKKAAGQDAFLGFEALYYRGVPIVADFYCEAGRQYYLNEDHLYMKTLVGADMTYTPPEKIVGEDTLLAQTLLSVNLNCDAPRSCGVSTGLPTSRTFA